MAYGANTWSVPTTRSSTTSGLAIALPDRADGLVARQVARVGDAGAAVLDGGAGRRRATWSAWWLPMPSQASSAEVSVSAAAGVPSRARRWRMLRSALLDGEPLAQGGRGEARGVEGAERGAVRLGAEVAAPEHPHGAGRVTARSRGLAEVDQQHVRVGAVGRRLVRSDWLGSSLVVAVRRPAGR